VVLGAGAGNRRGRSWGPNEILWLIGNRYSHGVGGKAGDGELHDFDMRCLSLMADILSTTFSLNSSLVTLLYSLLVIVVIPSLSHCNSRFAS
jgi:hypothetical protein